MLTISLLGCNNAQQNTNKTTKPATSIKQQTKQTTGLTVSIEPTTIIFGQNVTLTFNHELKQQPDSVVITTGNIKKTISVTNNNKIVFTVETTKVGKTNINTTFYWPNNIYDSKISSITVLSDIVPQNYGYKVIKTYPHNKQFYTQGLEFYDGVIYEGTGHYGQSALLKYKLENSDILQSVNLPNNVFGEGITILGNKIYQLTWQSGVGFVYDKNSFKKIYEFNYATEGWGLTNNGKELIMSDGSENIYFMDADFFQQTKKISVYDNNGTINNINELEYINGKIYANIYTTNYIIAIDPETGKVLEKINLKGLLTNQELKQKIDVLNGIAFDKANNRLFVTGKWWPKIFHVELIKQAN